MRADNKNAISKIKSVSPLRRYATNIVIFSDIETLVSTIRHLIQMKYRHIAVCSYSERRPPKR